jgi:hypothetical protein
MSLGQVALDRKKISFYGSATEGFCLLAKVVQLVDQHLNSHFGPYPIYVVVTKDWQLDLAKEDGEYTTLD